MCGLLINRAVSFHRRMAPFSILVALPPVSLFHVSKQCVRTSHLRSMSSSLVKKKQLDLLKKRFQSYNFFYFSKTSQRFLKVRLSPVKLHRRNISNARAQRPERGPEKCNKCLGRNTRSKKKTKKKTTNNWNKQTKKIYKDTTQSCLHLLQKNSFECWWVTLLMLR